MNLVKLLFCILVGIIIYSFPMPVNMDVKAWRLFAIFFSTILGLIVRPYPMGVVTLIGLCIAVFTRTLNIQTEALTGFSSHVIWLIVMVFFISRGFINTHLGTRIAYYFVKFLGRRTLSLGYGMVLIEFVTAPFIPSNTARAGGVILPIIKSICEALGSTPEHHTQRKVGSYLMKIGFQANVITSATFLTACAINPLAQKFAADQGIHITWINWFQAAIIPSLISLFVLPLFLYYMYPPQQKEIKGAVEFAHGKLKELGPLSKKEIYMSTIFLLMLVLWVLEPWLKINATTVAFLGVCLCILTNILSIDDILKEKEAWHILIWLSILVTMSMYLQKFGFISWFSQVISHSVSGLHGVAALMALAFIYYYSHYFFAGNASQVSAMYPAFLSVALLSGAPPLLSALAIGFLGSLYSSTTHYGTAAAPLYFSQKYITFNDWWRLGFIISVINFVIWFGLGSIWWKFLGLF